MTKKDRENEEVIYRIELGQRLKELREEKFGAGDNGRSACAEAFALTTSNWNALEKGRKTVSIMRLRQIVSVFKCSTDWVLSGEEQEVPEGYISATSIPPIRDLIQKVEDIAETETNGMFTIIRLGKVYACDFAISLCEDRPEFPNLEDALENLIGEIAERERKQQRGV